MTINDGFFSDSSVTLRNVENVQGSNFDDEIRGTNAATGSRLRGNGGKDKLYGGAHADDLHGGSGDDLLVGGGGADKLDGGSGADTLVVDALDIIARGELEDQLYWKAFDPILPSNNLLRGGLRTVTVEDGQTWAEQISILLNSPELYKGALGETYEVIGTGAEQGLRITMASGEAIEIENWADGEYGIVLETTKRRVPDFNFISFPVAGFPVGGLASLGTLASLVFNTIEFALTLAVDPAWRNFVGDRFRIGQLQLWAETPGPEPVSNNMFGTGASDAINGRITDDRISGADGDDVIDGFAGDDTLRGENGNDTLRGGLGSDRLEGGAGDDVLEGGAGNDTIVTGAGKDLVVIHAGTGADIIIADTLDTIRFDSDIDPATIVTSTRPQGSAAPAYGAVSQGALRFSFGSDQVTIEGASFGQIEFSNGRVETAATMAREAIASSTTSGDDVILGFGTADGLAGGAGNDYLNGLGGNDRYFFSRGDGQDRIEDSAGIADVIVFGAGITASDITVSLDYIASGSRKGEELVRLAIIGTDDRVEFAGRDIEQVRFADGTTWSRYDFGSLALGSVGTPGDDRVTTSIYFDQEFNLGGGDDVITTTSIAGVFYQFGVGSGQDRIELINDDASNIGARAAIKLLGELGLGDIKLAREGDGLSLTISATGDRLDIARLYDPLTNDSVRRSDIVVIVDGVRFIAADLEAIADRDEFVSSRQTGDATGNLLTGTVAADRLNGGAGNDELVGNGGSDLLFGGTGNDVLNGGSGSDLLFGESGDDSLLGGDGDDLLYSGKGSDFLDGGAGSDTLTGNGSSTLSGGLGADDIYAAAGDRLLYNIGDGSDRVFETAPQVAAGGSYGVPRRAIEFGTGIDPLATTFTLQGWSVFINVNGSNSDRIRLDRVFQSGSLPEIRFIDGTIWNESDILERILDPAGTASGLVRTVSTEPDWFNNAISYTYGTSGSDRLSESSQSASEYRFIIARGSGDDVIAGSSFQRHRKLYLSGFETNTLELERSGSGFRDLRLNFGTGDSILIEGQDLGGNTAGRVTEFIFNDTTLYTSSIHRMWLNQSSTNSHDTIIGFDGIGGVIDTGIVKGIQFAPRQGNDIIEGGLGNDLMIGGSGDDTYIVDVGDGADVIRDLSLFNANPDLAAGYDILRFGALSSNALFMRTGGAGKNLLITFANSSDSVTIEAFYGGGEIEEFEFGDGVVLTALDVQQLALAGTMSTGDDIITGTASPDTLAGGAGNDTLDGREGSDLYRYARGDGQDLISDTGIATSNTLSFGEGISANEMVLTRSGNGLSIDLGAGDGVRITNYFGESGLRAFDRFLFADGTRRSAADIDQQFLDQQATSGSDTITGFAGADRLTGGLGDDNLNGGAGADVYAIARGDGQDVIASTGDASAQDIIRFADGIDRIDLSFARPSLTSPDLLISVRGTSQTVLVSNFFGGTAISHFELADGTTIDAADVANALVNEAPSITSTEWRIAVAEGGLSRIEIPQGLFDDGAATGDLIFAATLAGGDQLPDWLTLTNGVFSINADDPHAGTWQIDLTGIDAFGERVTRRVAIDILNRSEAPIAVTTATQDASVGEAFSFTIPPSLFVDEDTLFSSMPSVVAGIYTTQQSGSFAVSPDGSYVYQPLSGYAGPDSVILPFSIGTGRALERTIAFPSAGSVLTGIVPLDSAPIRDMLTLTARLSDGSPLPGWLTFDGTAFSGTPNLDDEGPLAIDIIATDSDGNRATSAFGIRVGTANLAPVASATRSLVVSEGEALFFTIPESFFGDGDAHDRLTYQVSLPGGVPLPGWLAFDGRTLTGTPDNEHVGILELELSATDIFGAIATTSLSLDVTNTNDAPAAAAPIAHQLAHEGQLFTFAVPTGSFLDPDQGDALTLTVTLDTGDPLPGWLSFDGHVLSGTPGNDDTGLIAVRVVAHDTNGLEASQTFLIGVTDENSAPTIAETLATFEAPVDRTSVLRISPSLFADVDDPGYKIDVALANGDPLPSWISFDPLSESVTFEPGASEYFGRDAASSTILLGITATDTRGASTTSQFAARVVAPGVVGTINSDDWSIFGTSISERFIGGSGANTFRGGGGVDRIVFGHGSGQDQIQRWNDNEPYPYGDVVEFGEGIVLSDLTFSRIISSFDRRDNGLATSLLIQIDGSADELIIESQFSGNPDEEPTVREFIFADGTTLSAADVQALFYFPTSGDDLLRGGNLADQLTGGGGNDALYGYEGDDQLDGGAGDDRLYGDSGDGSFSGGGSDRFLFGRGSGNDLIVADNPYSFNLVQGDFEPSRGIDTLAFGPDITPEDLIITHVPGYPELVKYNGPDAAGSLLIQIAGTSDSVRIDNQFYLRYFHEGPINTLGIERFEFADGTSMDRARFEALITLAPTTTGDDLIAGGAGNDRLVGGLGNDILVGEDGTDTYVYDQGDGHDRIIETMQVGYASPIDAAEERAGDIISRDTLVLGHGISADDIRFSRTGHAGEDLVITFENFEGSITIEGQFRNIWHGGDALGPLYVSDYFGTENAAIDHIRFADGTRWSTEQIYAYSMRATSGDDVIDGFFRPSERLDGGAGNDLLVGRNGDDTYVFGLGYGHDQIKEFGWHYSDGTDYGDTYSARDAIEFVNLASNEITTSIGAGGTFIFTINSTGETLTILSESEFDNFTAIRFSDTTWSASQFRSRWIVASGTPGDDIINGFVGEDVINGGDGNDILQGGQNSLGWSSYDTLNGGAGNDTLTLESSDNDRANGDDGDDVFRIAMTLPYESSGLSGVDRDRGRLDYPDFVKFGTESGVIDGGAGQDRLILGGLLADYWRGDRYLQSNGEGSYTIARSLVVRNIEVVQFADATINAAALAAATFQYRPGVIEGTDASDVLTGTGGRDALYGYAGDDTLIGLDGDDFLMGGAGADTFAGGSGFDIVDYSYDTVGWNISLLTGQAVQGPVVETLDSIEGVYGSSGSDTITGSLNGDVLAGGKGDDTINAGEGDDFIEYEGRADSYGYHNEGFDAVNGGSGADTIRATARDAVIGLSSLSGVETITSNGFAGVFIQGSSTANILDFSGVNLVGIERIEGGEGNDVITGSATSDIILGGVGNDTLSGSFGDDVFYVSGTGDGFDAVHGGEGYDRIIASDSSTRIGLTSLSGIELVSSNGYGSVSISGSSNTDVLDFSSVNLDGISRIDGGSGNDTIIGTVAADVLQGSGGDDSLSGGGGNDVFQFTGTSGGFDNVQGGAGINSIVALSNSTVIGLTAFADIQSISANGYTGVRISGSGAADTLDFSSVVLSSITRIDGGLGNDTIIGSAAADTLLGSGGDDNLDGGLGDDIFQFSGTANGADAINGGSGVDTIAALAAGTVIGLSSLASIEAITASGFSGVMISGSGSGDALDFSTVVMTGIVSINGGAGNDEITGSTSADTILGGTEDDTLRGGSGDDVLNGGTGVNILDGGSGIDVAQYAGAAGTYAVSDNGDGTFALIGAGINDTLISIESLIFSDGTFSPSSRVGAGLTLTGTSSAETLTGGSGDDVITGLGGNDTLVGTGGNDTFRVTGAADGFDIVDGGDGVDTIIATANNAMIGLASVTAVEAISAGGFTGVWISGSGNADNLSFDGLTLTGITTIDGGAGNDTISGSAVADTIRGSAGDDIIAAGAGNDTIQFTGTTSGFDAIDGGAGTDTVSALANSTVIGLSSLVNIETITAGAFTGVRVAGSSGDNAFDFSAITLTNITRVEGGGGNDTLIGNAAANTLWGGTGNDVVDGGSGNDSLLGDDGDDTIKGGAGSDVINGGNGTDTVDYSAYTANLTVNLSTTSAQIVVTGDSDTITNTENVMGGSGADTLSGSTGANIVNGGSGNDRLTGRAGNDTMIGGVGTSDAAVYAGLQASYSVVTNTGFVTIVDNQTTTDGNDGTDTIIGIEKLEFKGGVQVGITSPIILDLDGNGIETLSAAESDARFDLDGDGLADDTSWIGASDAFLYLDRDGNGIMSGVEEISFVDDVPNAATDLAGLAAFDTNNDRVLDACDARFTEFGVWRDADGDGAVDEGENASLATVGIRSISLAGTPVDAVTEFGEVAIANTGTFTLTNGTTRSFADAALTYFSAATNLPSLAATTYDFDRKASKFRISAAGGALTVTPRRAQSGRDPLAGQLGANTALTFGSKTYGMFAPVVLDLDGDGVELVSRKKSRASFDYAGDGTVDDSGWIGRDDGFLVIDRNNDGLITEAAELTLASEDEGARSGLQGLARLDSDGDGTVNDQDARFGELRVWQDRNGNGRTDAGELLSLEDAGIVAIKLSTLTPTQASVKLDRNIIAATTSFVRASGTTSTAADVSLAYRPAPATDASTAGFARELDLLGPDLFLAPRRDGSFASFAFVPSVGNLMEMLGAANSQGIADLFDRVAAEGEPLQPSIGLSRLDLAQHEIWTGPARVSGLPSAPGEFVEMITHPSHVLRPRVELGTLLGRSAGEEALDAEIARKLAMIRQDMSSFGIVGVEETGRLRQQEPDSIYLYA